MIKEVKVRVSEGGRVVIPADYRKALGIKEGDTVRIRLAHNSLMLNRSADSLKHAQEIVGKYIPAKSSLADELIADRRKESRDD